MTTPTPEQEAFFRLVAARTDLPSVGLDAFRGVLALLDAERSTVAALRVERDEAQRRVREYAKLSQESFTVSEIQDDRDAAEARAETAERDLAEARAELAKLKG